MGNIICERPTVPEEEEGQGHSSRRDNHENGGNTDDDDDYVVEQTVPNLFEIPEMVEEVSSHILNVNDLKNLRLVSKMFRDESLDLWRSRACFHLRGTAERALKLTLGITEDTEEEGNEASTSTSTKEDPPPKLHNFLQKPFQHYKLYGNFSPTNEKSYFWERCCGPHIKCLRFHDETYLKEYVEGLPFQFILSSAPNLEELHIKPYKDDAGFQDGEDYYQPQLNPAPNPNPDINPSRNNAAVVAEKLKCLTISPSNDLSLRSARPELFHRNLNLCRSFFQQIPNLKNLTLNGLSSFDTVMKDLLTTTIASTGQPIQLESFCARQCLPQRGEFIPSFIDLEYLSKYLSKLERPSLRELKLIRMELYHLWNEPLRFKNILRKIKNIVEVLELSFDCRGLELDYDYEIPPNIRFDLCNVTFPKLSKLDLKFHYSMRNERCISFDFRVLGKTPNLKYFRFQVDSDGDVDGGVWLKKKITPGDLIDPRRESWRFEDGVERISDWEEDDHFDFDDADGDEGADEPLPFGGNDLVLDKLEEFHFVGRFSTTAFYVLGNWMKNLKVLGTIFDTETLPLVYSIWAKRKLQKVTLLWTEEVKIAEYFITLQKHEYPGVEVVKQSLYKWEIES